jgi:hypothetical protein
VVVDDDNDDLQRRFIEAAGARDEVVRRNVAIQRPSQS